MLKANKNKIIVLSLLLFGVIFIFAGSFGGKSNDLDSHEEYTKKLEKKIEDFLKEVDGIKDATVIITLEEYNSNGNEPDGMFSGSGEQESSLPRVRGVAVACTNGDNYEMQIKITEIVSKYLGIPTNKIKIVAKK